MEIDLAKIASILVPVAIGIGKEIFDRLRPEQKTPEIEAALALFNAMIAFLEVASHA